MYGCGCGCGCAGLWQIKSDSKSVVGNLFLRPKVQPKLSWPASMSLPHHYFTRWAIVAGTKDTNTCPARTSQSDPVGEFISFDLIFIADNLAMTTNRSFLMDSHLFWPHGDGELLLLRYGCLLRAIHLPDPGEINWYLKWDGTGLGMGVVKSSCLLHRSCLFWFTAGTWSRHLK